MISLGLWLVLVWFGLAVKYIVGVGIGIDLCLGVDQFCVWC